MHLIQLLLPLYDNQGRAFPKEMFTNVRTQLTEQFGGVTAFVRSPAVGLWKDEEDKTVRDEVIMMEVMTEKNRHCLVENLPGGTLPTIPSGRNYHPGQPDKPIVTYLCFVQRGLSVQVKTNIEQMNIEQGISTVEVFPMTN